MIRWFVIASAVALAVVLAGGCPKPSVADPLPSFWPDGKQAALSLTFDDGMPTQLTHAVPLLERLGLKATFYVNPGHSTDWDRHAPAWRRLAMEGHEIGNHTDTHPCPCPSDGGYCLEKLNGAEVTRAIDDAERALAKLTGLTPSARSFAYPCTATDWGAGETRTSYVPDVARRYLAARVGSGRTNDPRMIDLWYVSSHAADETDAAGVIQYLDLSMRSGHWAVLMFHGIGSEWNVVNIPDFERILKYVAEQQDRLWVAPFVDVAKYVRDRRQ